MHKVNGQKMAWNDPGNSGNKDPWGGNSKSPKSDIPPETKEIIDNIVSKFKGLFGNGGSSGSGSNGVPFSMVSGLIVLLFIIWLASGIYIVEPAERGVVLRFGSHVETTMAGPQWHLPYPIETVEILDVDKSRAITIGYRDGESVRSRSRRSVNVLNESLMLTKDENIINAKFAVQFKIKNAEDFLFKVVDPEFTLKQATESAIREMVGKSNMDFVLTEGRAEIAAEVEKLIQRTMDNYQSGVLITQVTIKDVQPPDQVQEAFADVVKAQEDNRKFINQAEAYRNDILPRARGKVARIIAEANAYKEQIVAKSEGETSRFKAVLNEYRKSPKVTRKRMHLETMQMVLSNTGKVILDAKDNNALTVLPLDKLISAGSLKQIRSPSDIENYNNSSGASARGDRSTRGGR